MRGCSSKYHVLKFSLFYIYPILIIGQCWNQSRSHILCHLVFLAQSYFPFFTLLTQTFSRDQVKPFKHSGVSQCQPTCRHNKAWKPQETSRGHEGGFKNVKPTGSSCYRGGSRSRGDTDTGLIEATGSVRVVEVRLEQHLSGRVEDGAALAGWYQFHHSNNTLRHPAVCFTWTQRYDCSICTSATTQTTINTW